MIAFSCQYYYSLKHSGAAVPSSLVPLHHRAAAQTGDPGVEQSGSVSSSIGGCLETLHDVTFP